MDVKAAASGLTKFAVMLVQTILFPLMWMKAIKIAKAHSEYDNKAVQKVAAGIAIGVLLAAVGFMAIQNVQQDGLDGMYETMDGRMQQATLESDYQAALESITTYEGQIATIDRNIGLAEADRDAATTDEARAENDTMIAAFETAKAGVEENLADATQLTADLLPNHNFYLSIAPMIEAKDDEAIKQALTTAPESVKQGSATKAFAIKDKAVADMAQVMNFLVLPGLVGAFYGPMIIALGNVLRQSFEPSETVGFKPYPGGSMGTFLILGGFGIPSILFTAWTMMDVEARTAEPQIAL